MDLDEFAGRLEQEKLARDCSAAGYRPVFFKMGVPNADDVMSLLKRRWKAMGWYPFHVTADAAAGMIPMSGSKANPIAGIGASPRRYGAEIPARALR